MPTATNKAGQFISYELSVFYDWRESCSNRSSATQSPVSDGWSSDTGDMRRLERPRDFCLTLDSLPLVHSSKELDDVLDNILKDDNKIGRR